MQILRATSKVTRDREAGPTDVGCSDASVKVWDLPTRIFHWAVVVLVAAACYTAENGLMEWHYRVGITALGLIFFRLIWGVVGGATARFSNFVRSPRAAPASVR